MKVYLSAPGNRLEEARDAMTRLRTAGHTITHDWVAVFDAARLRAGAGNPFADEELAERGRADLDGVRRAGVVVVLTPGASAPSPGVLVELGMALALGKRIVMVEPPFTTGANEAWKLHPFRLMVTERVENLGSALALLCEP